MKAKIKEYFESLNPKKIGLKGRVKVSSIRKLGMGAANANYLVNVDGNKFVFRMNIQSDNENFSRKEYEGLKAVGSLKIAPKVWILDTSKKVVDGTFIILSYVDGKICPNIKSFFTKNKIIRIANLLWKVHSIKIKGKIAKFSKGSGVKGYQKYLISTFSGYFPYIRKNLKNKNIVEMLEFTYNNIINKLPKNKYNSKIVLSHGDFHAHNILFNKGEFKLIDFEAIKLDDNAIEIAGAFMEFDNLIDNKGRELFLKTYLENTKGDYLDLHEKVFTWLPLRYFTDLLWAIRHVLKLKKSEMHEHYVKNTDFISHVNYTRKMFNKCIREGVIDKKYKGLDIKRALMR